MKNRGPARVTFALAAALQGPPVGSNERRHELSAILDPDRRASFGDIRASLSDALNHDIGPALVIQGPETQSTDTARPTHTLRPRAERIDTILGEFEKKLVPAWRPSMLYPSAFHRADPKKNAHIDQTLTLLVPSSPKTAIAKYRSHLIDLLYESLDEIIKTETLKALKRLSPYLNSQRQRMLPVAIYSQAIAIAFARANILEEAIDMVVSQEYEKKWRATSHSRGTLKALIRTIYPGPQLIAPSTDRTKKDLETDAQENFADAAELAHNSYEAICTIVDIDKKSLPDIDPSLAGLKRLGTTIEKFASTEDQWKNDKARTIAKRDALYAEWKSKPSIASATCESIRAVFEQSMRDLLERELEQPRLTDQDLGKLDHHTAILLAHLYSLPRFFIYEQPEVIEA